jgi:hypothetical protein
MRGSYAKTRFALCPAHDVFLSGRSHSTKTRASASADARMMGKIPHFLGSVHSDRASNLLIYLETKSGDEIWSFVRKSFENIGSALISIPLYRGSNPPPRRAFIQ